MRAVYLGVVCVALLSGCSGSSTNDGSGGASSGGSATGGTGVGGSSATGGTGTGGAGAVGGSAGGSTGGSAGTSTGGSAGTSTGGSAGTGGTSTDAGVCGEECTKAGFVCCGNKCVNLDNDLKNCGKCGIECTTGEHPSCNAGKCGAPPCSSAAGCTSPQFCCGDTCCAAGKLCCDVPGPLVVGVKCVDPVDGTCPMGCKQCKCAAPDTPIATPRGERKIAELVAGDWVLSVDHGRVVPVRILSVGRTPAKNHSVLRVTLATGRVLQISPAHPTADGRTFAELRAGTTLDGVRIRSSELVAYTERYTFDILPDSDSGSYFAAGVLVGTTLRAFGGAHVDRSDASGLSCQ